MASQSKSTTSTLLSNEEIRSTLVAARSIVIKIGSGSLTKNTSLPAEIAMQCARLRQEGRAVVLVSSGAVALGAKRLGYAERPTEREKLQAAASVGQSELMWRYDQAFQEVGMITAQVLLNHTDLSNRKRLNNARAALKALTDAGAVPIVNENDAVSTDELSFSDNDHLSAMVTPLVDADALLLLTNVDGVLDANQQRIPILRHPEEFIDQGSDSSWGTGGMRSKLSAAKKARRAGATVVVAGAFIPQIITKVFEGQDVGTCFPPLDNILRARHHWIAYTLKPRGTLFIDAGAERALCEDGGSLLPVGVHGLRGEFRRGDAVRIVGPDREEIGRGLCRMTTLEVARSAGRNQQQLAELPEAGTEEVVVHRDDMVIWPDAARKQADPA